MKKYRYEIIIFTVDAICMILELIASRVISPYFGNSNIVWTSVIGIILLSSSIGNYLGGLIADKKEVSKSLKIILMLTALSIFIIPILQKNVLNFISQSISDIKIGAVLAAVILFFIPSLLMGILTPIIVKLKLDSMETAGKVTGRITAIATIGGIVGTFLGGFVLIPSYGSIHILYVLTILIALLMPAVNWKLKDKSNVFTIVIVVVSIILMISNMKANNKNGNDVLEGTAKNASDYVSYDTQYGRVLVYNTKRNNENVRMLNIDSGYESATYTDEGKQNDLVFAYTKFYDLMFKANIDIKDTMLIGGAGYSYPKYFISHYPDKNMDVVEIDGEITEIAKKYFYLDKLIKDYNIEQNHRLNLITADGRTYLNDTSKKYDAILNDAFSGNSPAKTLTTVELVSKIKNALNNEGVYLTNIISSLEGENSKFIKAEVNTLKKVFTNVYVVPCNTIEDLELSQNNMVIATDSDLNLNGVSLYNLKIDEDEIVLTDDYCPVDTLIPQD